MFLPTFISFEIAHDEIHQPRNYLAADIRTDEAFIFIWWWNQTEYSKKNQATFLAPRPKWFHRNSSDSGSTISVVFKKSRGENDVCGNRKFLTAPKHVCEFSWAFRFINRLIIIFPNAFDLMPYFHFQFYKFLFIDNVIFRMISNALTHTRTSSTYELRKKMLET